MSEIEPPSDTDVRRANVLKAYLDFSGLASDVARKAAFAGVAIIWIFAEPLSTKGEPVPQDLLIPSLAFLSALACDFLHYAVAALIYGLYHRVIEWKHKRGTLTGGRDHPSWLNWPAIIFFWGKIGGVSAGYAVLARALYDRLL